MECFLVGPDGTSSAEGLFQVSEHLEEGHPRLYFRRRSARTQMSAQNALTSAEMPVKPVAGVQRQRNAGLLPCGLDGTLLLESLNESPQLFGVETPAWNAVSKANTRRSPTTPASRTLLATETPCTYAALLR